MPWRRRLLVMEAAFWLLAARLAILMVPFPRIAPFIGQMRPPAEGADEWGGCKSAAEEISWAIDRAARLFPFRLVCFPRALAGWKMLDRRQIAGRIHFGAAREAKALTTHAWLDACGAEISGYPQAHRFVEIGYFAR